MRLLRSFPIMAFALVLVSLVGFCAAQGSVVLLFVAGALAALSWYVTEGPRGRTLPRWLSTVLVLVVSLGVLIDLAQHREDVLGVLGRLCVWLTLIKLYERRTARDHAHLMGLSLLLMLVGCLKSESLLFGLVLLLYAVLGLYVLLLLQLYLAHETVVAARRSSFPGGGRPAPALRPTIGRRVTLHFRALAAGIGLVGLMLSIILFVIFPRSMGQGMVDRSLTVPAGLQEAGYADEIDLVRGSRITDSQRPVFDVRLVDDRGRPMRLESPLLLRGAVLDTYLAGVWTASGVKDKRIETNGLEAARLGTRVLDPAPALRQEFRFRAGTSTIFALYVPIAVQTPRPHAFACDPATQTLLTTLESGPVWRYTVFSRLAPDDETVAAVADGVRPPSSSGGIFADETDPSARRVRALAERLLEEAGLTDRPPPVGEERWRFNERAARAFCRYLQSGAFTYTLDVSDVVRGGTDPIVQFLFESRRGHCEFYASALAALCHSVRIDARVVTGYIAGGYDEIARRYLVVAGNAHAWVEVRTGLYRYTPMDPTPAEAVLPAAGAHTSLPDRLGWFYQRLEGLWRSRIIEFNNRSQAQLLEKLDVGISSRLEEALDATWAWMARVNRAFSLGQVGYVWLGIVAFALVLAVLALIKIIRRIRSLRRALRVRRLVEAEARRLLRHLGVYLDMLIVLRKAGLAKPECQPPLAYATSLHSTRPTVSDLVRQIVQTFYEARYGGRRLSRDELVKVRALLNELASTLKVKL
jgi:transglutaminase-like putative cysteine protease